MTSTQVGLSRLAARVCRIAMHRLCFTLEPQAAACGQKHSICGDDTPAHKVGPGLRECDVLQRTL